MKGKHDGLRDVQSSLERGGHSLSAIRREVVALTKNIERAVRVLFLLGGIAIGATAITVGKGKQQTYAQHAEIPDIPPEAFDELFGFTDLPNAVLEHMKKANQNDPKMRNAIVAAEQILPLLKAYKARAALQRESALLYMMEHERKKLALWRTMPFAELQSAMENEVDPRHKAVMEAISLQRLLNIFDFKDFLEERKQSPKYEKKHSPKPLPEPQESTGQLVLNG